MIFLFLKNMYIFPISDQWKCLKWWQSNSTEPLATQAAVSKYYFPFLKKQSSWEKWLIPYLGKDMHKMSLEHPVSETKEVIKD